MFLIECMFFAWVVDRGEARGWLRSRNPSVNPELERGWKWNVCLCPPWSRLMSVNSARLRSLSPSTRLHAPGDLFVVHVPAQVCLFYFPRCVTCGWLIAFSVLTGPGAWLSRQPPWGMCLDSLCGCVCVCLCVRALGGRSLTPLICSTPLCLFSWPKRNLSTDVMWHRAVSLT